MNQRLQKLIASAGIASRRHAEDLIVARQVTVNGEVIVELGAKADPETDHIKVKGRLINPLLSQQKPVYVLLNKPKGFITTTEDPHERKTVMDLVANSGVERLYPVGRLDRNTTGLLLMTNDGDLAQKLSHPSYEVKKLYQVSLDKQLTKADFDKIMEGVELEDGKVQVDEMSYLDDKKEL